MLINFNNKQKKKRKQENGQKIRIIFGIKYFTINQNGINN